jgi:chromosome segregation protein
MIEQGRIDYILKADPEERRFLIEEAAGIAKYKVKKDESIRKLERTEENLKRLQDIVFEVQKNIQYAERQAKRAERYKLELERLKMLEIKRAFHDQRQIKQKKLDLTQNFQSKKDELTAQVQEKETKIGYLETELATLHAQSAEASEQKTSTLIEKESLES